MPLKERQCTVNDMQSSILENPGAVHLQLSTILLPAGFLRNYEYNKMVTLSQTERQQCIHHY